MLLLKTPLALLTLGAVALVVAVAWWLGGNPAAGHSYWSSNRAAVTMANEQVTPTPAPADESDPFEEGLEQLHEDEDPLDSQALWAEIANPANCDLEEALFREVAALAADVVRADLTGRGRDRWLHYWPATPDGRAGLWFRAVNIHAAGAVSDPARPGAALATVVWSADPQDPRADPTQYRERISTVHLIKRDDTWEPIASIGSVRSRSH